MLLFPGAHVTQVIGGMADKSSILRVWSADVVSQDEGQWARVVRAPGRQRARSVQQHQVRHFVLEGKLTLEDEVSADRAIWQSIGSVDEVVPLQMRDDAQTLAPQQGGRT